MPVRFLPALVVALAVLPAQAQQAAPTGGDLPDRDTVTVALAVASVPDYEGSDEQRWTAMPAVRAQVSGMSFTWRSNRLWADLIPNRGPGWDLQLGPLLNVNLNRAQKARDAPVAALGTIDAAAEVGVRAGIGYQGLITSRYDKLSFTLGYVHDVSGVHRSAVLTPSLDYGTPLSHHAMVDLSLSADYVGNGYAQTYFGVTPSGSAASGLPVFVARKGWKDWTLGGLADLSLSGDLTHGLQLIAAGSYRRLLGDAAASPLTRLAGSPDQWTGAVGLAFTF